MWTITLRDLQFRRRQFAIAVVGAGLAFALALVMTGMSAGFRYEVREVVGGMGAQAWIVPRGVTGPFTSESSMPAAVAEQVRGGGRAEPIVDFGHVLQTSGGDERNINVIGHSIGALGDPDWNRAARQLPSGQVVVDERLGVDAGETVTIGGRRLRVVRVTSDRTLFAGTPLVFVSLEEAQAIAFAGRPLATAILSQRTPTQVPPGFVALSDDDVRADLLQPMDGAVGSIDMVRALMWTLAVVIIGAVTYLSALERLRDFAVLKAVGGSGRTLVLSLAVQAVVAALLAALLGAIVAQPLKAGFPLPVVIEPSAYIGLPIAAIAIGILASAAAMRRATKVDPALAFAGG